MTSKYLLYRLAVIQHHSSRFIGEHTTVMSLSYHCICLGWRIRDIKEIPERIPAVNRNMRAAGRRKESVQDM